MARIIPGGDTDRSLRLVENLRASYTDYLENGNAPGGLCFIPHTQVEGVVGYKRDEDAKSLRHYWNIVRFARKVLEKTPGNSTTLMSYRHPETGVRGFRISHDPKANREALNKRLGMANSAVFRSNIVYTNTNLGRADAVERENYAVLGKSSKRTADEVRRLFNRNGRD